MKVNFSGARMIAIAALTAAVVAAPAYADVIWDSGAPTKTVMTTTKGVNNDQPYADYLSWTSGNVSAERPQRWAAAPFTITKDVTVNEIWAYMYNDVATDAKYIIWKRSGLTAPTEQYAEGTLGAAPGALANVIDAPYLCKYAGFNINLAAGDYYMTIYGADTGVIYWGTGGTNVPEALETGSFWRSEKFPTPGFVATAPTFELAPGANLNDIYNPCFSLHTNAVPEPGSILVLGTGLLGLAASFRKKLF